MTNTEFKDIKPSLEGNVQPKIERKFTVEYKIQIIVLFREMDCWFNLCLHIQS